MSADAEKEQERAYSPRLQEAIQLALTVHEIDQKQRRRSRDLPYITHPLTVAIILSRVTRDEDLIIAGILHDVVEDCEPPGRITVEYIRERFGDRVANIVADLTEPDKTLPWEVRKAQARDHILVMSHDSLLVKSADILHNISEMVDEIARTGDAAFSVFHASKSQIINNFRERLDRLRLAWPENPLLPEIETNVIALERNGAR